MTSRKTGKKGQDTNSLSDVPVLTCSFIVPTEDRKGVYLIVDDKGKESVFQVDGYGSDFCRGIDGSRSASEIADELIQKHQLPAEPFKSYVSALQGDLKKNGLLTFQAN